MIFQSDIDADLSRWLLQNERKAILPFKWGLFVVTVVFWLWRTRWLTPSLYPFSLFSGYFFVLCGATYLLCMGRIIPKEARCFSTGSFFIDVVYVTLLVYLDQQRLNLAGEQAISDFFYFYFILVLRGYTLSMSRYSNLTINILLVVFFLVSYRLAEMSFDFFWSGAFQFKLALLWLIILMSWFLIGLIDQQRNRLIQVRERLIKTQQLADLGQMASLMAHEINNPVAIISAHAEFLMRSAPENEKLRTGLMEVRDQAHRCRKIIDELTSYTQPSSDLNPSAIPPADFCREAVAFVFGSSETHASVEMHFADNLPDMRGEPSSLRRALINILVNARNAAGPGGLVTVNARRSASKTSAVDLIVTDNGPSMTSEEREHALEPFAAHSRGGAGLALALARRIIEEQNGRLTAEAPPEERGLMLRIQLPTAQGRGIV